MMNCLKKLMPLILVNLLKKADYDNKISGFEGKIPNITGLVTSTALTAVETKIISLKDHKNNFRTSHPCCLIDQLKCKLGKISKVILENVNKNLVKS